MTALILKARPFAAAASSHPEKTSSASGAAHERLQDVQIDPVSGMHVGTIEIEGQILRVGIRPRANARGYDDRRPLLVFNGIGANLELCGPMMSQLDERESIVFDVPGAGNRHRPSDPTGCSGWLA